MNSEEVISKFKEIDFSTVETAKSDIVNVIRSISHLPSYIHRFEGGQVLSRIRPNENGKSFKTFKDLSYKPEEYNNSYQRASGPEFTMFYGGYIPELDEGTGESIIPRVIAAMEGSPLIREDKDGTELVTFSKWRIVSLIELFCVFHPTYEKNHLTFFKKYSDLFEEGFGSAGNDYEQGKAVLELISSEFSKNKIDSELAYMFSALFTDSILKQGFDGVIYPSVRTEYRGVNVALTPERTSDSLMFEMAMECEITKKGKEILVLPVQQAFRQNGSNELEWKPIAQ